MAIVPKDIGGRLRVRTIRPNGEVVDAYPDPPLHATATVNGQQPEFLKELMHVLGGPDVPQLRSTLKNLANERNHWVYASERGLHGVAGDVDAQIRITGKTSLPS